MSFDKHSNFNKQANFTEVKFGENKPVLEVELNELQQIQNEARADIIRDSIPSGFTQLGDIDYEYCLNYENKIKLKTDSVAYVNGYRINIPKNTYIDIGKAPEKDSREDLVFLEVWKEEVNSTSTLYKEGGEGQASIPNNIKDSRYPIETTHRVALKWRIRHVANVDFNRYHMDGFSAGTSGRNRQVTAQGGSDKPFTPTFDTDATGSFNRSDLLHLNDKGLFVTSQNAELFKTFDGYVYAISMFRLYRKPSCGKSIPFEYSKLNPKVDYDKFTKLIKEDKVERIVTETIKGRSLVNLDTGHYNCQFASNNDITMVDITNGKKFTKANSNSDWQYIFFGNFVARLKADTQYTVFFNYKTNRSLSLPFTLPIQTGSKTEFITNITFSKLYNGVLIGTFTTPSTFTNNGQRVYLDTISWSNGDWCEISEMQVIEGVLNQQSLPKYFKGVKSLGEDDNNVITLKNEVLNDDTYDINDGNQKLVSFPEVTHVNCKNSIAPTIEASVVNGDESTPLAKLNTKVATEGHEVIEFTKIKGKTIQNLCDSSDYSVMIPDITENTDYRVKLAKNYLKLERLTNNSPRYAYINCGKVNKSILKPSTIYTLVFSTITNINEVSICQGDGQNPLTERAKITGNKAVITTVADLSIGTNQVIYLPIDNYKNASLFEVGDILLLEGDHSETPLNELFFVEGIKSVGETEDNIITLHSTGKNLFNKDTITKGYYVSYDYGILAENSEFFASDFIKVNPNSSYYMNITSDGNQHAEYDINGNYLTGGIQKQIIQTSAKTHYIRICNNLKDLENTWLHEGTEPTTENLYVEYTQNIKLKEPLRSLPNGVCDEIVGNKVIRGVGQDIFTGSTNEDWKEESTRHLEKTLYFEIPKVYNVARSIRCSHFPTKLTGDSATVWTTDSEVCNYDNFWNMLVIRINRSRLATQDLAGFKKWLSENNVTVVYGLVKGIEEPLVNAYEKESVKTYQLDAPLRSLPNGVKDEIKDGVLIRRVGEKILNGTEDWGDENSPTITLSNVTRFILNDNTLNAKLDCHLMPNDRYLTTIYYDNEKEGIYSDTTVNNRLWIHVLKTNLEAQDTTSLKKWLQSNPVKFIYELATPVETRLKEVNPSNVDFSLNRQFAEGNYLRELPNGVKDTVENGKVIRRVGKATLKGSETFEVHSSDTNFDEYKAKNMPMATISQAKSLSNTFPQTANFRIVCSENTAYIRFPKSMGITSTSLCTSWFTNNPTTILYELESQVEENLTTENCNYFPVHDFNTYCGSMYVGQGRNYVSSDNKMPTEDTIIVETDFRKIEGNAKIEDCNFKKSEDGYDTLYVGSKSKNLALLQDIKHIALTEDSGNLWTDKKHTLSYEKDGTVTWVNNDVYEWSDLGTIVRVKPNTKYTFSLNLVSKTSTGTWNLVVAQFSKEPVLDSSGTNTPNYLGVVKLVSSDILGKRSFTFTTPNNCCYIYCMLSVKSYNTTYVLKDFMINEGDLIDFELGLKSLVTIENTEENDIDDLRHSVSLTGFNYEKVLNESFDKLLRGEL